MIRTGWRRQANLQQGMNIARQNMLRQQQSPKTELIAGQHTKIDEQYHRLAGMHHLSYRNRPLDPNVKSRRVPLQNRTPTILYRRENIYPPQYQN